eukprot:Blabericola_migrator_1__1687@NODE_1453_length_4517_cov_58_306742_g960_i0_p2_GENE_NODE_1453_length_4517_cov_58_306742_g960_i0NODE_1453_length_4517_cov_58_306742_g960_i0_p2_ORF_typecomplete_len545_score119_44Pro_isomerase/PF00160_21/4_5e55Rtf2/PF04641_12/1_1e25Rtf2/PF04641_12/4_6e03Ubox/PF04564_15/1_6e06Ubox/PF04564_15/1_5Ubox/PF04564_15/2e03zfNse/PF11789_8/0_13zfNse/PF11789_8/6_3e05zfNOSIP/PF15906_5/0_0031zfNOSIP/PF15906_5/1_3e03Exo84_C/PF16528_5/2_7e03Exo84_C/PF16528_5/0_022C_adapt/PF08793_10/0_
MGKQRHQKDRLYLIPSEYALSFGGYKRKRLPYETLPFHCCGLTLLPFKTPVIVDDKDDPETTGIIFDKDALLEWLKEYSQNPVTGKPLKRDKLVELEFHRSVEGEYHCPITYKVFNNHSAIVANKKSRHVYSKEAIDEICRKSNMWRDLITNEPFNPKKDLVTIQDPGKIKRREISQFYFVKEKIDNEAFVEESEGSVRKGNLNAISGLAKAVLQESTHGLERKRKHMEILGDYGVASSDDEETRGGASQIDSKKKITAGESELKEKSRCLVDETKTGSSDQKKQLSNLYTTSGQAASFTSTAVLKKVGLEFRELKDVEIRHGIYDVVKKMGARSYVKLVTNLGPISLELRSDLVPETCDNFMRHAKNGTYTGTIFHRLIPRFMIQGGDPEGTGRGGKCAFDGSDTFHDDFKPDLRHNKRGILSMANSGMDTNRSQFFITFASAPHLDDLHTVFGSVVDGWTTLDKMEALKTDKQDRPEHPLRIHDVHIYEDAFEKAVAKMEEDEKRKAELKKSEGEPKRYIKQRMDRHVDPKEEKLAQEKSAI